jgi:hypothetical protein
MRGELAIGDPESILLRSFFGLGCPEIEGLDWVLGDSPAGQKFLEFLGHGRGAFELVWFA